jgi:hypothetical protein
MERRTRLIWALGLACAGLMIVAVFSERIYNTFAGPFPIEMKDLVELREVPLERYVTVKRDGRPLYYGALEVTGDQELETGGFSSRIVAHFEVMRVGSRRMLVRIEDGLYDEVVGIVRELDAEYRELSGSRDLAVYLDCTKSRYKNVGFIALCTGLLLIGLGADQVRRAYRKPKRGPLRVFT